MTKTVRALSDEVAALRQEVAALREAVEELRRAARGPVWSMTDRPPSLPRIVT